MSIYEDIRKVTQIPETDEIPLFIYTGEQNTLKRQKFKKPRPPRNANLYDPDNEGSVTEKCSDVHNMSYMFGNELTLAIRKANGGVNYSNEDIERYWRNRREEARLNSDVNTDPNTAIGKNDCKTLTTEGDNAVPISNTITNERQKAEEESILKKCKLNKNAVIRGLLKHHKISLQDLQMPYDCMDAKYSYSANIQEGNTVLQSELCKGNYVTSAQWPDDPEAFVHPLLPYGTIDETKYKNIDFAVPHIGKKKKVTARTFFINMDDSNFNFVRNDIKKK